MLPNSNFFLSDDRESALIGVREIFKALESYAYTSDELSNFVNQKDGKGRTALHIVLEKDYSNVEAIALLLNNGATVSTKYVHTFLYILDKLLFDKVC